MISCISAEEGEEEEIGQNSTEIWKASLSEDPPLTAEAVYW